MEEKVHKLSSCGCDVVVVVGGGGGAVAIVVVDAVVQIKHSPTFTPSRQGYSFCEMRVNDIADLLKNKGSFRHPVYECGKCMILRTIDANIQAV